MVHWCKNILIICSLFFVVGCDHTYPSAKMTDAVVRLCKKEYALDVESKLNGKTLGVYLTLKTPIVDKAGSISAGAIDQMGNIFMVVSRVALSTDKEIDFCVAVIADPTLKVEWLVTRYLRDVKLIYFGFPREEIFRRTDFDLRPLGKYKKNDFELKDVKLTDFLAKQITTRIKSVFNSDKTLKNSFSVEFMETVFKNPDVVGLSGGYNGGFSVYYKIKPKVKLPEDIDKTAVMAEVVCGILKYICNDYGFSAYDNIELVDMDIFTTRNINKSEIESILSEKKLSSILKEIKDETN